MDELRKVSEIERAHPERRTRHAGAGRQPGQNALTQAEKRCRAWLTGIVITKPDGTAKEASWWRSRASWRYRSTYQHRRGGRFRRPSASACAEARVGVPEA
jgi:hypothetical protein